MKEKKTERRRQCFIVGPIGKADGEERIHSDWLLEAIIEPVFSEYYSDFKVLRADKISKAGMINTQIIEALLDADLVIADITMLNPNAFYEIGIRHMAQKPIIHMHLEGQSIPFDIAPFRSIEFSLLRPKDIEAAKRELMQFVEEVLDTDYKVDNPVTVARGKVALEQTATESEKLLLDELEALKSRVAGLEFQSPPKWSLKPSDLPLMGTQVPSRGLRSLGVYHLEARVTHARDEKLLIDFMQEVVSNLHTDETSMSGDETWRRVDIYQKEAPPSVLKNLIHEARMRSIHLKITDEANRLIADTDFGR